MIRILFLSLVFLLPCLPVFSEENKPAEAVKNEKEAEILAKLEEKNNEAADWLEFYYQDPTPEQFIDRMKDWAVDGTLQNHDAQPALIGFISQLMRQNRDKIWEWARELSQLDPKDMVVYNTALVFSRTGEADDLIKKALAGSDVEEFKRPPKILEIPLSEQPALNMLWGYFYATGSESAIRRILHGFRYEDAPLAPDGVKIPEGYKPFYTELPALAFDSIHTNMQRHPRVREICVKLYEKDKTLLEAEKRNLYDLLALWNPEKYPPRKVTKSQKEE